MISEGLTYFVELPPTPLTRLFARPGLVDLLQRSHASIALAMQDFSLQRREVLQALNAHHIPVTAWLVLDESDGYWLNADNAHVAQRRYESLRRWAAENKLRFDAVGLDIETPLDDIKALFQEGRRAISALLARRRSRRALEVAAQQYRDLCQKIKRDGYRLEAYHFPMLLDERQAGSTLLRRLFGVIEVPVDREVLMLYRSLLPGPLGNAVISAYGPEAQAIAVGITGGGVKVVLDAITPRLLDFHGLCKDLRNAARFTPHLYVFSLEGCVEAGYFEDLCEVSLAMDKPRLPKAILGKTMRRALQMALRCEGLLDRWL